MISESPRGGGVEILGRAAKAWCCWRWWMGGRAPGSSKAGAHQEKEGLTKVATDARRRGELDARRRGELDARRRRGGPRGRAGWPHPTGAACWPR